MTDYDPFTPRPVQADRNEHVYDFWTVRGATGRDVVCGLYRVATGLELRTQYAPEEIIATRLFRGPDADERVAETADAWRVTLIAKGFREIATGI